MICVINSKSRVHNNADSVSSNIALKILDEKQFLRQTTVDLRESFDVRWYILVETFESAIAVKRGPVRMKVIAEMSISKSTIDYF